MRILFTQNFFFSFQQFIGEQLFFYVIESKTVDGACKTLARFALVTEQKNSFLDDIESFLLGSEYFVECFSMGDLFAPASADVDLESIFSIGDGVEAAVSDTTTAVFYRYLYQSA